MDVNKCIVCGSKTLHSGTEHQVKITCIFEPCSTILVMKTNVYCELLKLQNNGGEANNK